MRSFTFAYGSGSVSFELDEKNILGVLHGNEVPPLSDIPAALTAAFIPGASPPLVKTAILLIIINFLCSIICPFYIL